MSPFKISRNMSISTFTRAGKNSYLLGSTTSILEIALRHGNTGLKFHKINFPFSQKHFLPKSIFLKKSQIQVLPVCPYYGIIAF